MMPLPHRVVLMSGLQDEGYCEPIMKFRLTYEGELRPTQGEARGSQRNPLAQHKWEIRKVFHDQLKHLWAVNPTLRNWKEPRKSFFAAMETAKKEGRDISGSEQEPFVDIMADSYVNFGHKFVPLAHKNLNLICSLDILFLRRDIPGSAIHAGDIDNRIKTLIDTLRMPKSSNEMAGSDVALLGNEPFFCLLEDDDQVSHFAVETDTLLDPPSAGEEDIRRAKLIITVEIRPYLVTWGGLGFLD